jgi:hypothetical protein
MYKEQVKMKQSFAAYYIKNPIHNGLLIDE